MQKLPNEAVKTMIVLDKVTAAKLEELAKDYGISRSAMIRWLITQEGIRKDGSK